MPYIKTIKDLESAVVPDCATKVLPTEKIRFTELTYEGDKPIFRLDLDGELFGVSVHLFHEYCSLIGVPPAFGRNLFVKHPNLWHDIVGIYGKSSDELIIAYHNGRPITLAKPDLPVVPTEKLMEFTKRLANRVGSDMVSYNFSPEMNVVTVYEPDSIFGHQSERHIMGLVVQSSPIGKMPITVGEALLRQVCMNGLHSPVREIKMRTASLESAEDYIFSSRLNDLMKLEVQKFYISKIANLDSKFASYRELQTCRSMLPEGRTDEIDTVLRTVSQMGDFNPSDKRSDWLATVITPVRLSEAQRHLSFMASHMNDIDPGAQSRIQEFCGDMMQWKFDCDKISTISLADIGLPLGNSWK